jgi:glutamine amidotransferase
MTTVLVDYESGNLHSAEKAFQRMAAEVGAGPVIVTSDPDQVARADRVVLPGDGAFPACRRGLRSFDGLEEAVIERSRRAPCPSSASASACRCWPIGAASTRTSRASAGSAARSCASRPIRPGMKVPHMGWNDLNIDRQHPVLEGISTGDHAYFVHSYAMKVADPADLLAHVDYGGPVTAIVARDTVVGTQFHPEKSQRAGLRLIANFLRWRP